MKIRDSGGIARAIQADNHQTSAIEEQTLSNYEDTLSVNVRTVYVASTAALKYLAKGGRINTIGSNIANGTFGSKRVNQAKLTT